MTQHRSRVGVSSVGNPQSSGLGLTCACPRPGLILPVGKTRLCAPGQPRASLGTWPGKGGNRDLGTVPVLGLAGATRSGPDPAAGTSPKGSARGQMAPRSPKLPIMPLICPTAQNGQPSPAGACIPPQRQLWDLWLFLIPGSYFGGERLFSLPAANPVSLFNLTQLFSGAGPWAAPAWGSLHPGGVGVGGIGWEALAVMG